MSVREGQARLRKISKAIADELPLSKEDRTFLSTALMKIALGDDAERALGVKAKRGERKGYTIARLKSKWNMQCHG